MKRIFLILFTLVLGTYAHGDNTLLPLTVIPEPRQPAVNQFLDHVQNLVVEVAPEEKFSKSDYTTIFMSSVMSLLAARADYEHSSSLPWAILRGSSFLLHMAELLKCQDSDLRYIARMETLAALLVRYL